MKTLTQFNAKGKAVALVTGTPGSGKTTLAWYARSVGDERFIDADEIVGLCEWRNLLTNQPLGLVSDVQAGAGDDWYKQNGWFWRLDFLKQFLNEHKGVIICGSAENVTSTYELFLNVIVLRKTESELLDNLINGDRVNPFGKTEAQRSGFMRWQDHLIEQLSAYNSNILDGNNIEDTYEGILKVLGGSSESAI